MEVLQSDRGCVYEKDGFLYHANRCLNNGTQYLVCAVKTCKSRAKVTGDEICVSSPHNHPADDTAREMLLLKAALKWAAVTEAHRKPRDIFKDVSQQFPRAAPLLGYNTIRSTMYRYQRLASIHGYAETDEERFQRIGGDHVEDGGETSQPQVDSDVASQLDFTSMSTSMSRARRSAVAMEVETQDSAVPSDIEISPCASTSSIQFAASDITCHLDPEFGTLDQSGMPHFVPTTAKESTCIVSQDADEKEETSADEVLVAQNSTAASADLSVIESIDVAQSTATESAIVAQSTVTTDVAQYTVTKPSDVAQSTETKPSDVAQSTVTKPTDVAQSTVTKPTDAAQSTETKPTDVAQSTLTKPTDVAQSTVTKLTDVAQSTVTKPATITQSNVTKPVSVAQLRSTTIQERKSYFDEDFTCTKKDAKKLESAIQKLESVSNKLAAAALADKYDQFGKYISSLLRGLPHRTVNSLKKKIVTDVLKAIHEEEKDPYRHTRTVGIQAGHDVIASERAYRKLLHEQSLAGKSGSSDAKSVTSNIPILGGNMPILFPGTSTPGSSFKLLPVIPMSGPPRVSGSVIPMSSTPRVGSASVVPTPSLVGPATSGSPISPSLLPMTPCETVTTVAKSADGTLLAVTIPKPQMTETLVGTNQSPSQPSRGQKRKQTTAAYLIKKCSCVSPNISTSTGDDSSLDIQATSLTNDRIQTDGNMQTTDSSRISEEGELSGSVKKAVTQKEGTVQSTDHPRDSGGGNVSSSVDGPMKSEDQEFEMDIEEGNQLAEMKQDQDLFETVMCGETSDIYIKEEAPDPEEISECDGDPPPPSDNCLSTPAPLICSLCNSKCSDRDELVSHFFTTHPGREPSAKAASGSNRFVT